MRFSGQSKSIAGTNVACHQLELVVTGCDAKQGSVKGCRGVVKMGYFFK
jgi:hypothetical protein